jgi:hypothetical protein
VTLTLFFSHLVFTMAYRKGGVGDGYGDDYYDDGFDDYGDDDGDEGYDAYDRGGGGAVVKTKAAKVK